MLIAQALQQAQAGGLDRLDAQLLLLQVLGRPHQRAWLLSHDDDALSAEQAATFLGQVARRAGGEPLAYVTGEKEFFGLPLSVDSRVLIPRPDTETLVEWALQRVTDLRQPRILDLGTGSGAIALALKRARPDAQISAVDLHPAALAVAQANGQRLNLRVDWLQSHWLDRVDGTFDLIVSNPPYIASDDPHLAALQHEPQSALVAGDNGLQDLRHIITQAPKHLRTGAWLLLEHGWQQAARVRTLLTENGFQSACSRCDLAGIERCSGGQTPKVK